MSLAFITVTLSIVVTIVSIASLSTPITPSAVYRLAFAKGIKTMAALLVIREKIIKPVLAGVGKPQRGPKPKNQPPVNEHYQNIQSEMIKLFHLMGIAV